MMDILPNDVVYVILSEYIPMPWICKRVYQICVNNPNFIKNKRDYIICKFSRMMYDSTVTKIKRLDLMIRYNPKLIQHIPESEELCKLAVANDGLALEYINDEFITKELCDMAFRNNPSSIQFIPHQYITSEMCLKAIEHDPHNIGTIPDEFETQELCDLAFNMDSSTTPSMNIRFVTREMYDKAIKEHPSICFDRQFRKYMNPEDKPIYYKLSKDISVEDCYRALQQNPFNIKYIPRNLLTSNIINIAIGSNPMVLEYISQEYHTLELYYKAVSIDGGCLGSPNFNHTIVPLEIYYIAIKTSSYAIKHVPFNRITYDMCRLAVTYHGDAFRNLYDKYKVFDLLKIAMKTYTIALHYIDKSILTEENWKYLYEVYPYCCCDYGVEYVDRFITEYDL